LVLTKEILSACALTVPLTDRQEFARVAKQVQRLK
jgi:hypothetical protein